MKKCQKILHHCHFNLRYRRLYQVATSPIYSFAEPNDNANISAQQKVFLLKKSCQFAKSSRHTWDKLNFFTWFPFPVPGNTLLQFNFPILPELPFPLECTVGNLIFPHLQLELPEMHPSAFSTVQCSRVATKIFSLKFSKISIFLYDCLRPNSTTNVKLTSYFGSVTFFIRSIFKRNKIYTVRLG